MALLYLARVYLTKDQQEFHEGRCHYSFYTAQIRGSHKLHQTTLAVSATVQNHLQIWRVCFLLKNATNVVVHHRQPKILCSAERPKIGDSALPQLVHRAQKASRRSIVLPPQDLLNVRARATRLWRHTWSWQTLVDPSRPSSFFSQLPP